MENCINLSKKQKKAIFALFALISLIALIVRSAGLYHGLQRGQPFHPDTTKQVQAVENFLHGHLVWYTGSLAYDGYPYGLNHIDATLMRVVWPAARGLRAFFIPGDPLPRFPDRNTLFYFARAFRVFYGMLAFLAFSVALKKLNVPVWERLLWLLLAASAPLLSVVTHSAAGDVGTDLFVMLALLALVPAREGSWNRPFFLSGFFLGCAFACKYHGILGGIVPGLLFLFSGRPWRERFRAAIGLSIGTIAGFVLLTPHIFIRFSRTLRLIRDNFRYIRRYNVPAEFYEQPVWQRLSESLTSNIPIATHAVGYALSGILILTLFTALIRFHSRWIAERETAVWDWAVMIMPIGVLLLALSGKPRVQPFHFSFLPLPFLLAAAVHMKSFPGKLRFCFCMLLLVAAGEQKARQREELAHWLREDTRAVAFRGSEKLLYPASEPRNPRKLPAIVLEGENLAVFRNRPQHIRLEDADDWLNAPPYTFPRIPYSLSPDWILLNWPRFPRDAQLLHLQEGHPVHRRLVDTTETEEIVFAFRNGHRPADMHLRFNRERMTFSLKPFQEKKIRFSTETGSAFVRGPYERVRHDLSLRVTGGSVLAEINPLHPPSPPPSTLPDRTPRLSRARFLEGETAVPRGLALVPVLREQHLPPGRYRMEVTLPQHLPPKSLHVRDAQTLDPVRGNIETAFVWRDTHWEAEWEMPHAPLFSHIAVHFEQRPGQNILWRIRPLELFPPPAISRSGHSVRFHPMLRYARGRLTLGNLTMPPNLARGEHLKVAPQLRANTVWIRHLEEHVMFYHLLDETGAQVFARDIPLTRLPFAPAPRHTFDLGDPDLPPGEYTVLTGLYRPRTETRLRPERLEGKEAGGRRTRLGTLTITD